jgi:hypothetical protein
MIINALSAVGVMYKVYALLALALSLLPGCAQKGDVNAAIGEPFQLKINQTAYLASENLTIRFLDVPGDSRCPSDVVCVWAGEVTASVEVERNGYRFQKNITERSPIIFGGVNGYSITLVGMQPYPKSDSTIPKSQYIATFMANHTILGGA